MEITLVIVTLFSLALALGMGVLLWRLLQDDRHRADARVAALVEGFAQRTSEASSASSATDGRGPAREANAEAPAFALRDRDRAPASAVDRFGADALTPRHVDDDTHAHLEPGAEAIANARDAAHPDAEPDAPHDRALETVHLGAAEKDWLLEFPSAARTEETRAGSEWGDVGELDDADDASLSQPAWPDARRAETARQAQIHDWRDVREPRTAGGTSAAAATTTAAAAAAARTGGANGLRYGSARDTQDAAAQDVNDARGWSRERTVNGSDDADLPLASDSARELFGQVAQANEQTTTNRFTQVAVGVALVMGLMLAIWTVSRLAMAAAQPSPAHAAAAGTAGSSTAGAGAAGAAGATTASAASTPLELLALRHSRNGNALTINGLVRNPSTGARQERLTAVVFFFNQRGEFLTSARAPLDFRTLAPGDESPFQVTMTTPPGVHRYRVSFRYDEGGVVSHVDRRPPAAAPGQPQAGS